MTTEVTPTKAFLKDLKRLGDGARKSRYLMPSDDLSKILGRRVSTSSK